MAPQYLTDLFCKTSSIHDYNTRFAQDALALPKPNSNTRKKSFSYRGAVAWNNLLSDLKKIDSLRIIYKMSGRSLSVYKDTTASHEYLCTLIKNGHEFCKLLLKRTQIVVQ